MCTETNLIWDRERKVPRMTIEQTNKWVRKEIQGKEGNKTKLHKGKSQETNNWSFKRNYFS